MREDVALQWRDDIDSTRALGVANKIRTVAHCCDPVTHLHFSEIKKSYLVISLGLCGGYWWYINLSFVCFIYTKGKRIFKEPSRIFAFRRRTFVNANSTFVWALLYTSWVAELSQWTSWNVSNFLCLCAAGGLRRVASVCLQSQSRRISCADHRSLQ